MSNPSGTKWPFIGSVGLTTLIVGFINVLNGSPNGKYVMIVGALILIYMLFGWFGQVIQESENSTYGTWEDKSFRLGMSWFIFSEVMFFAAFFGALFYARVLSVPWLGGVGEGVETNRVLWEGFSAMWPTNGPGEVGGELEPMAAWGLPALNTIILLTCHIATTSSIFESGELLEDTSLSTSSHSRCKASINAPLATAEKSAPLMDEGIASITFDAIANASTPFSNWNFLVCAASIWILSSRLLPTCG